MKTLLTDDPLLPLSVSGEVLGTSISTLTRLIRDGHLRSVRVGRQIRIQESVIREFINRGGAGSWKRPVVNAGRR